MKVEVIEVQTTPPPKEYVLTLSEREASVVCRALLELSILAGVNDNYTHLQGEARKLWDQLCSIGVPNLK